MQSPLAAGRCSLARRVGPEHSHGLGGAEFDAIFAFERPVIFAFHAYPALIHKQTDLGMNHVLLHVHGYQEEGAITAPFDPGASAG